MILSDWTGHLFVLLPIHPSFFFLPYLFSDILFMHLCRYIPHRHSPIAWFFLLYQYSSFGFFRISRHLDIRNTPSTRNQIL